MRLGVLRKGFLDIKPRSPEQVTQGVLVFEAVHASLDRTSLGRDARGILLGQ